ncbi:MAG: DUF4435 domain-containing protein [Rikenellaceae bacterium]|jgi:hypothetical protein|nr:DUF4435 domain-containing protein [Rikenellaceae bacterium]
MKRLTDNISSRYFEASDRLRGDKRRLVRVFVEGYDDVSFWRVVFDRYTNDKIRFEISVPARGDLAKGKKAVMKLLPESGPNLLLCVDSDFDYLFGDLNEQSRLVNRSKYLFHTYAYAVENYHCHPPSLHGLCVKATKIDRPIFDFGLFMKEYSKTVYPVFLWYAFSASLKMERAFTLVDFRNTVRINFLDSEENGRRTIEWLGRQVDRRLKTLEEHHAGLIPALKKFEERLVARGLTRENVHCFMQGHTLKDNVVLVLLETICDRLQSIGISTINTSDRRGVALKNELSNYNNSLREVKNLLDDNDNYETCELYLRLRDDIRRYVDRVCN